MGAEMHRLTVLCMYAYAVLRAPQAASVGVAMYFAILEWAYIVKRSTRIVADSQLIMPSPVQNALACFAARGGDSAI